MSHGGIDIGDRVSLRATFRLAPTPTQQADLLPGTPANPTTVTLRLRRPSGPTEVFVGAELANPATGVFELVVDVDQPGLWLYRWEATGAVICAEEGSLVVRPSAFL